MAKLQLTIASDYCPTWGIYEGVREILQNCMDSNDDGFRMVIEPPTEARPVLSLINKGARLDRATLLLGVSSKRDGSHRGLHGEGMKIGTLALVRAGRQVAIVNDDETWAASLEHSESFGQPVLTIFTRQRTRPAGEFRVEIELTPAEWADFQLCFIDLQQGLASIETTEGQILTDDEHTYTVRAINIWDVTRKVYINRSADDANSARTPRASSGIVIQEVKV